MSKATQLTVEELEERAEEARERLYRLEARAEGEIQSDLREVKRSLRRAQVESAKQGSDQGEVSARLKLERLEAELDDLPEQIFYARLRSVGAGLAVEEAKVRDLEPKVEEAREEATPLVSAAKQDRKHADAATGHSHALRRRLTPYLKRSRDTLPGEVVAAEDDAQAARETADEAERLSKEAQQYLGRLQSARSNASDAARRLRRTLKSIEDAGVRPIR